MPLEIVTLISEPLQVNTYLIADSETRISAVIDPSFDAQAVLDANKARGWNLRQIWLTHAHFDHIAGVEQVANAFMPPLLVGLHPADMELWSQGGGGDEFGFSIKPDLDPAIRFYQGQVLTLGLVKFLVRHAPGHTHGHVLFYCPEARVLFCGDVLFKGSVGRTDLPGSSHSELMFSIRSQVINLPEDVRVLPGHGPETTVGEEKKSNPFFKFTSPLPPIP
jgi:hydroxyacylglutathione hydrolase